MFDVKLLQTPLNVGDIYQSSLSPDCGAVSIFAGVTRDNCDGKKVTKLVYEAYESMALKMMYAICEELKEKWPAIKHVIIHHRLGEVNISEPSVVIAVSSPHRKDSLESVNFAIDKLKAVVPIFKKEEYENFPARWKQNKECEWAVKNNEFL